MLIEDPLKNGMIHLKGLILLINVYNNAARPEVWSKRRSCGVTAPSPSCLSKSFFKALWRLIALEKVLNDRHMA